MIKGQNLQIADIRKILMEVCIKDDLLLFGDYPNFKNINKLEKYSLHDDSCYRLAIWFNL